MLLIFVADYIAVSPFWPPFTSVYFNTRLSEKSSPPVFWVTQRGRNRRQLDQTSVQGSVDKKPGEVAELLGELFEMTGLFCTQLHLKGDSFGMLLECFFVHFPRK